MATPKPVAIRKTKRHAAAIAILERQEKRRALSLKNAKSASK